MTADSQDEDLRGRQPDADGDGDRDGQRRHAQLHAGDDGAEVLERRRLPDHGHLGSNPNYNVTPTDDTLTIGQKAATVTADHKSKTYGDDNPALTATVTGTVNGDTLELHAGDDRASKFSNVGDYPITVSLGTNPNYHVSRPTAR